MIQLLICKYSSYFPSSCICTHMLLHLLSLEILPYFGLHNACYSCQTKIWSMFSLPNMLPLLAPTCLQGWMKTSILAQVMMWNCGCWWAVALIPPSPPVRIWASGIIHALTCALFTCLSHLASFALSIRHSVVIRGINDWMRQNWMSHTFLATPFCLCSPGALWPIPAQCVAAMPTKLISFLLPWNFFSPQTGELLLLFLPNSSLLRFVLKSFLTSPLLLHLDYVLLICFDGTF